MKFKAIAETIIELKEKDLALRGLLIQKGQLGPGYNREMAELHRQNAAILDEIIDAIGYPTTDKVGQAGSEAAWLVIQHAIGQPAFMKKCAHLLGKAVEEQQADPIYLAYLTDRIAVFEGQPQRYGTQFDWDENLKMSPQLFDDLDRVNERRKAIGLNTLQEQIKIMRERVVKEKQTPPADLEARKKEIEEWRKSVGWGER